MDPVLPKYQTSVPAKDFNLKSDKGLIIFSTTVTGENSLGSGDLYLRDLDSKFKRLINMWGSGRNEEGESIQQDPRLNIQQIDPVTVRGKIHALELEPGEYEFYHYYAILDNYELSSNSKFYLKFFVGPGDVLYLGNLDFYVPDKIYTIRIADRRKRDLAQAFAALNLPESTAVQYQFFRFKP